MAGKVKVFVTVASEKADAKSTLPEEKKKALPDLSQQLKKYK